MKQLVDSFVGVCVTTICVAVLVLSCGCQNDRDVKVSLSSRPPGQHVRLAQNNSWSTHPSSNSDTTFIFVHGILSSSETCWIYKEVGDPAKDAYFPQLLSEDPEFSNCGVFSAGYGTELGSGKYSVSDRLPVFL